MAHYFLGIDVSKGYADFKLLDEAQTPVGNGFQLDDTASGHEKLVAYLRNLLHTHAPDGRISAGVESTGGYEDNWYRSLAHLAGELPVEVARLNPARVKAHAEANGRRTRTDQTSAQDVAEYLATHTDKLLVNEPETTGQLRRLWTHLQLLTKQQSQLASQLQATLYTSMPELLPYCRGGVPGWLLHLLERYPTYAALTTADLMDIPYLSPAKARTLHERLAAGATTIGGSTAVSGTIIRSTVSQILALEGALSEGKRELERLAAQEKEVALLRSFKSIGAYAAVGLLVYIGDIHRFPSAKHLASYFGVHPLWRKSGDGVYGMHMSKQGASEVRALLYIVSFSAIQHNVVIRPLYRRCRASGMSGNVALGVCMHKILRIVYGMLIHERPFNPSLHRARPSRRQGQAKVTTTANVPAVLRRDYDEQAPISTRQQKKRKAQAHALSQDDSVVTCGITRSAPSPITVVVTNRTKHKRNHQKKQN